ncbi:hypothetical protein QZH41_012645 [Actinostola sp. cb2023]|nr:hypothetical protein QZH41_012645 [Actinostola sp. cb2023]
MMHLLPLNVVKNHIERLISTDSCDAKSLNINLSKMPWTTDYCASRLPRNLEAMGSWKAEEFQKFAFPASEFVLYGLLSDNDYKVWAPIPRMVECVFSCGRNGWTDSMIQNFKSLAWRYCILFEEEYGTDACVINLHNLTHLSDDVHRFSSPDNYWCFDFERAVKRYVRQSSNKKHIEKSFARRESQREFIKFRKLMKQIPSLRSRRNLKFDRVKVTASSLENARALYLMSKNDNDIEHICSGVLTGAPHFHILTDVERQTVLTYCSTVPSHEIGEAVESYKKCLLAFARHT